MRRHDDIVADVEICKRDTPRKVEWPEERAAVPKGAEAKNRPYIQHTYSGALRNSESPHEVRPLKKPANIAEPIAIAEVENTENRAKGGHFTQDIIIDANRV